MLAPPTSLRTHSYAGLTVDTCFWHALSSGILVIEPACCRYIVCLGALSFYDYD